ncbi:MAG: UDP-N-acetylmuramate dehydrogenase [Terriglobia bacterium]
MYRLVGGNLPFSTQASVPLKPYTTFKIGGPAWYFADVQAPGHLREAMKFAAAQNLPVFVLGGGSNVLVSDRGIESLVLHPTYQGLRVMEEGQDEVLVQVGAGKTWDGMVAWAVDRGYWGIENLSHIPGQAGAALVQNIGAYGQQLSDVLVNAVVMNLETCEPKLFAAKDCGLGYRESIFNTTEKGRWLIWALTLRLNKHGQANLKYPDLAAWFQNSTQPALGEIRAAVIAIRDRKFPFPREEKGGNAGSFFKNLMLNDTQYRKLQLSVAKNFDSATHDRLDHLHQRFAAGAAIKIPSAFLIEACGLKGLRMGGAQVNESQPLVLLNQGGATADDVLSLARHIRQTVYKQTSMVLPLEPELVGFTPEEIQGYMALES